MHTNVCEGCEHIRACPIRKEFHNINMAYPDIEYTWGIHACPAKKARPEEGE